MSTAYAANWKQHERLAKHPKISGPFAIEKRLWEGRRVAVEFMRARGDRRHTTDMRIMYGTLVLTPNAPERTDQIGVRDESGEVHVIHKSRAKNVWDLTRTKDAK